MDQLPFINELSLFENIKSKYLINALRWIGDSGDQKSTNLIGSKTGNLWGVGYGLICLLKSRQIYLSEEAFPAEFDTKAKNALIYLMDKACFGSDDCNWDNNIWDTSVICRTILHYIEFFPDCEERRKSCDICLKAMKWLHDQVSLLKDRRYSLGIPDISQTLRTFILARKLTHLNVLSNEKDLRESISLDLIINELLNEIVNSVDFKIQDIDGKSEEIAVWDDDEFATSDAIICLSRFIQLQNSLNKHSELETNILSLLQKAIRFLEINQVEGKWGIEETTTLALQAYILGSSVLGNDHTPEPHIVFKAVRYLCDPKTIFLDGSIAHKMEPTVYLVFAFLEILEHWELPNHILSQNNINELYDYVIWNTPTRSTHERDVRIKIQSELHELKLDLTISNKKIIELERIVNQWRTIVFLIIWGLLGYFISILFKFIQIPEHTNEILLPVIDWTVSNWEVLLAFLTLFGGVGWFIYDRVLHWNMFHNY